MWEPYQFLLKMPPTGFSFLLCQNKSFDEVPRLFGSKGQMQWRETGQLNEV